MIKEVLMKARELGCSDIHMTCGQPVWVRKSGELQKLDEFFVDEALIRELMEGHDQSLIYTQDLDFTYSIDSLRHRVNVYRQKGKLAAVVRILDDRIQNLYKLGMPPVLDELIREHRGIILVTGATGSGKSTTMAAMIEAINVTEAKNIITIEDPVEYMYQPKNSLISQREVGADVKDFPSALKSALREDPDIILVGEMRDKETIHAALTAAETGHLVISTLHSNKAASTIDRIIDSFPQEQQNQIRVQLASSLRAVLCQQLIKREDAKGRVANVELLVNTDSVAALIRDGKTFQLGNEITMGKHAGMVSRNQSLVDLVVRSYISEETARSHSDDVKEFDLLMSQRRI